jgi:hypothetical protein
VREGNDKEAVLPDDDDMVVRLGSRFGGVAGGVEEGRHAEGATFDLVRLEATAKKGSARLGRQSRLTHLSTKSRKGITKLAALLAGSLLSLSSLCTKK